MSNVNYKSDLIFLYWDEPIFTNSNSKSNESKANEERKQISVSKQMQGSGL